MITGSAARNPEELGPGFLNIHKTLMSLYSALHQGMSAIYIMLPLRSVTGSLSFTCSLTLSLSLLFYLSGSIFRHDFFPQRAPERCLFSRLPLCYSVNACYLHRCHRKDGIRRDEDEGGGGWVGRMGISEGFGWGKVAFPSPVQRHNKRDECLICPLKLEVH